MPFPAAAVWVGPAAAAKAASAFEYLSSASLGAVLVRIAWKRCVPEWIREDISFRKSNNQAGGGEASSDEKEQQHESLSSVIEKIQLLIESASDRLQQPAVPFLYASVLAYIQLVSMQLRHLPEYQRQRNEFYHTSGPSLPCTATASPPSPSSSVVHDDDNEDGTENPQHQQEHPVRQHQEELEQARIALDHACWSYFVDDEDFLRTQLGDSSFVLEQRFLSTRPGSIGYYMAISSSTSPSSAEQEDEEKATATASKHSNNKICIISVKGSTTIEDLVTDTCLRSISYHEHYDREEEAVSRIEVSARTDDSVLLTNDYDNDGDNNNSEEDYVDVEVISGHERIWIEEHFDDEDHLHHHIRCHEGIYVTARRLANRIHATVRRLVQDGYSFVLTGHSLGGGVASILSLILKARFSELSDSSTTATPDNNRIRVYAFGPPPTLDHDTALASSSFITSVINNGDMIVRSSLANLAVFLEVLRVVSQRLQQTGQAPTNPATATAFLRMLAKGDKGEPLLTVEELSSAWEDAQHMVELRHPDHLYVPGRVLLMFEDWEAATAVTAADIDEEERTVAEDKKEEESSSSRGEEGGKLLGATTPYTSCHCTVTDGCSSVLRWLEIDGYRSLGDHTTAAYYSRFDALLGSTSS